MENSIKDIITNSLEQVRSVVGADTIIGQPIRTESGTIIIPVSKISIGMATGGLDIPSKTNGQQGFGGGGGTGVTISPIGFLTVYANGAVEMLPLTPAETTPFDQVVGIIDRAPEMIARVKEIFSNNGEDPAEKDAEMMKVAAQAAAEAAAQEKLDDEIREEVAEAIAPLTKKELKAQKKQQKKEAKAASKESK